jgi:hypothetical protein
MVRRESAIFLFALSLLLTAALPVSAQSFRVQCPDHTITHPVKDATHPNLPVDNNSEPLYAMPTTLVSTSPSNPANGYLVPSANVNGAIKCQQISGGDGYATMGDGTQTYMFSFGPLSGLVDIANGNPHGAYSAGAGTESPVIFNQVYPASPNNFLQPGDPATTDDPTHIGNLNPPGVNLSTFTFNGAVGLANNIAYNATIYDISEGVYASQATPAGTTANTVTVILNTQNTFAVGDAVIICGTGTYTPTAPPLPPCGTGAAQLNGYDGTWTVNAINITNNIFPANFAFQFNNAATGLAEVTESPTAIVASVPGVDGHVDPRQILDIGVMNGNIPAPLIAIDEDDELFLTLTNVGMIMRPDLFEQHTVHFHGYPNASAFYDGVPDASVAINIGGSFTYYYLAPDAGTYFWHCHITPPEHLQMGMVGQLYVRPRQNRVASGASLYNAIMQQQQDPRTASNCAVDILCAAPVPASNTMARAATGNYAYNDGDGSTHYDVEYPLQMHGFDPNFHFVGMTFNPEGFTDMKDKYFMLNGRSYPDTVTAGPLETQSSDGVPHFSQPLSAIINIPAGKRALLRISNLDVSEYQTLASMGIPMTVIALNAKLLRDQAGNNLYYNTNSITLGGGESLDVILDATNTTLYPSGSVFYLYTSNLDHLSNDAENFGGLMTEVRIN